MLENSKTKTPEDWFNQINEKFTPSKEEQLVNILSGQCPHNGGFYPFGLNLKPMVFKCKLCGDIKFV